MNSMLVNRKSGSARFNPESMTYTRTDLPASEKKEYPGCGFDPFEGEESKHKLESAGFCLSTINLSRFLRLPLSNFARIFDRLFGEEFLLRPP